MDGLDKEKRCELEGSEVTFDSCVDYYESVID